MNRIIFLVLAALWSVASLAQSDQYVTAMKARVAAIDTTFNPAGLKELSIAFERIADAEKTQWLPYYYAALTGVNAGYMLTGGRTDTAADQLDLLADKAEQLLAKAEALSPDNSEIFLVKKMIATLRMIADPVSRYQEYAPQAQQALETARRLNPSNPRVYLLEGQDKLFTPEQFGGSKAEARRLFEEALKKYETFHAESALHPGWGRGTAQHFLSSSKQ